MTQKNHRIAVLSDTHGLLRPEVTQVLKTCEIILHGGDINSKKILQQLEQVAPVYAVRGNNDKDWAQEIAEELEITLFGLHIYMIHNKKHRKENLQGTDIFIYGHSHKYDEKTENGVVFLNPGSCGPRRFKQPVTMAVLEVCEDTGEWKVQKVDLTEKEGEMGNREKMASLTVGDIKQAVEFILREMAAGRDTNTIADRLGVEWDLGCCFPSSNTSKKQSVCDSKREFVEQVCRIYVTHPGVDVQGIIDKMEVNALTSK